MNISKKHTRLLAIALAAGAIVPATAMAASASTYSGHTVSCSGGKHVVLSGTGRGTISFHVVSSGGAGHSKSDGASSSLPWSDSWNTGLTKVTSWKVSGTYVNGGSAFCA